MVTTPTTPRFRRGSASVAPRCVLLSSQCVRTISHSLIPLIFFSRNFPKVYFTLNSLWTNSRKRSGIIPRRSGRVVKESTPRNYPSACPSCMRAIKVRQPIGYVFEPFFSSAGAPGFDECLFISCFENWLAHWSLAEEIFFWLFFPPLPCSDFKLQTILIFIVFLPPHQHDPLSLQKSFSPQMCFMAKGRRILELQFGMVKKISSSVFLCKPICFQFVP